MTPRRVDGQCTRCGSLYPCRPTIAGLSAVVGAAIAVVGVAGGYAGALWTVWLFT
jgi:hypothetical protein